MNSYKLNDASKQHEQHIIEQIITNNGYDTSIIKQFHKSKHEDNTNDNRDSWAKFTYFGRETKSSLNFSKKHSHEYHTKSITLSTNA
jgi:hypothetical protein